MEKKKTAKKIVKKTTPKKKEKKNVDKKKKGFTLIELLAVIIILGILMIIAIPSVTSYISDSRKSAYVDTAKEIVGGTRNIVNEGNLGMYDTNTTYFIPSRYIQTENASKSPYGEFTKAYVGVIYNGTGYKYYWISVDETGQGVSKITPIDSLDTDDIESDLTDNDIESVVTSTGIGNRNKILIFNPENETWDEVDGGATNHTSEEEIPSNIVCIKVKNTNDLHTKTCENASGGCGGAIGIGNTITYGTIVNGTPKPGDAYDCKVTANGGYRERFYYVGSEGENSVLIYYKNMDDQTTYAYDSVDSVLDNWHGPRTGYQYLPSTSAWNNPRIIAPGTRTIKNEQGNNSTTGGTIENFTYTNKAARLLTIQELVNACPSLQTVGSYNTGELDGCNWFLENVDRYEKGNETKSLGYWLETPLSSNYYNVWLVVGGYRIVSTSNSGNVYDVSIRPVITIKTSDLG